MLYLNIQQLLKDCRFYHVIFRKLLRSLSPIEFSHFFQCLPVVLIPPSLPLKISHIMLWLVFCQWKIFLELCFVEPFNLLEPSVVLLFFFLCYSFPGFHFLLLPLFHMFHYLLVPFAGHHFFLSIRPHCFLQAIYLFPRLQQLCLQRKYPRIQALDSLLVLLQTYHS